MAEADRLAVAIVKLRLMGTHISWIEYIEGLFPEGTHAYMSHRVYVFEEWERLSNNEVTRIREALSTPRRG